MNNGDNMIPTLTP